MKTFVIFTNRNMSGTADRIDLQGNYAIASKAFQQYVNTFKDKTTSRIRLVTLKDGRFVKTNYDMTVYPDGTYKNNDEASPF